METKIEDLSNCKKCSVHAAFEAILFSYGQPVSSKRASEVIGISEKYLEEVARDLIEKFEKFDSGIRIIKIGEKYQMCSKPEHREYIQNFISAKKDTHLSSASLEVLAIVAYKQPVTRSFIENIRGVDCREIVNNLTRKCLIEEKGRLNIPGNPITYGTTDKFLRCMGISSLENLPIISENICGE